MRIAIVDDLEEERSLLRGRLSHQLSLHALHGELIEFESGTEFLAAARKNPFQVVFLDIYMNDENGIDIAQQLRDFDKDCILVFTTTSSEHALEGFRVRALHYLVKPYSAEDLQLLFEEVVQKLPAEDKYIEVKIVGGIERVRIQEILYAEHYQHQMHIATTKEKTIVTRMTFGVFKKITDDARFFQCNRGSIVNLEHASDFDGSAFLMNDGTRISVSRDLAKEARLAFGDYLFKRRPLI